MNTLYPLKILKKTSIFKIRTYNMKKYLFGSVMIPLSICRPQLNVRKDG